MDGKFCRDCVSFHNLELMFGKIGAFLGRCDNPKSDHYKHVITYSHPRCERFFVELKTKDK